jgi:hypothetical protein
MTPATNLDEQAITVFTPYYAAGTPERQAELDLCLERNLACAAVSRLVLLIDDGHTPPVRHPKLQVLRVEGRPSYAEWVRLTQKVAKRGISVLANSDIYFDQSVSDLRKCITGPETFLALSRYEKIGKDLQPHAKPKWSQDVWGFHTDAVFPPSLMKALEIPLGVPRCDNKVAYLFGVHGWQVYNPLRFVRSIHVHETQQRNYDKKADLTVVGSVAYVHPSPALDEPAKLEVDVWALRSRAIEKVSVNPSLDNWAAQKPSPVVAPQLTPSKASPAVPAPSVPAAREAERALASGESVFRDELGRFRVVRHKGELIFFDRLQPLAPRRSVDTAGTLDPATILSEFIPPVLDTQPIRAKDRPASPDDHHFWQYPAATERQAYENHLGIARGANVDAQSKTVHTYLALPWATYIDRKVLPEEVLGYMAPRVQGLSRLARELGYSLRVHTVCQQIYWRRILDSFVDVGVTDLHISHAVVDLISEPLPLRVHSWPLIAPNIEVPDRRKGLIFAKPLKDKRYLASFIGAHMPHYLSNVRVRLAEISTEAERPDILVDLGKDWHFNKVVYNEQVKRKPLSEGDSKQVLNAAAHYNEVLSDSVFSLCPEGAGPNTLRLWESLAIGAIPVVIADDWLPPNPRSGDPGLESCAVFISRDELGSLFHRLDGISNDERERMARSAMTYYQAIRDRTCFTTPSGSSESI